MRLQSTQASQQCVTSRCPQYMRHKTGQLTRHKNTKKSFLPIMSTFLTPPVVGADLRAACKAKAIMSQTEQQEQKEPAGCSRCRPLLLVASLVPYHQSTCALSALYVPCRCCCDLTARTWLSCLRFGIHFLLLSLSLDERSYDRCESDQGLTTL